MNKKQSTKSTRKSATKTVSKKARKSTKTTTKFAYFRPTTDQSETMLQALVQGIQTFSSKRSIPWTGTVSQLQPVIVRALGRFVPEYMPRSPSAMRVALNRVVGRLRKSGYSVQFSRDNSQMRTRLVTISS